MKLLLKVILRYRKHFVLLGLYLCAILGLTLSSQAEIFSLGVIAKSGPDAFMLFARKENQQLVKENVITREQVLERWSEISPNSDVMTTSQANAYLARCGRSVSITSRIVRFISKYLDLSRFGSLSILLILVAIFKAMTLFFHRFLSNVMAIRISRDVRRDYFGALQKLPMSFFHAHDMGNLSSRVITDSANIASAVNSLIINYIQAPVILICALCICLSISWKFSLLVSVAFPVFILPIVSIARKIKTLARKIQKNQDDFTSVLLDFLTGILTVKIFRTESFSFKKYCDQNQRIAALEEKSAAYGLLPRPLLHTIASLFFAFVVVVGMYRFKIPPEELLVFCGLLYLIYEPVKKFGDENTHIMRGCAAAERFYEVISHSHLHTTTTAHREFHGLQSHIEYRNVSFAYGDGTPILHNINLKIKKGEAIGIVGPTGSGKTTLTKLLPRLYDVSQGEILLDGVPIHEYTIASLRSHISCVLQSPFLFYDSIWNNLTFGKEIPEEEVVAALQQAYAYEFVQKMPQGMHTMLEESGKNLSGGQLQRLTIARALLKNASILILDEATSSLDAVSENYIKEISKKLKGQCTQIIIAHKLSTLEYVDRVIYVEHGQKIAEGARDELLSKCPGFLKMWELSGAKERPVFDQNELIPFST